MQVVIGFPAVTDRLILFRYDFEAKILIEAHGRLISLLNIQFNRFYLRIVIKKVLHGLFSIAFMTLLRQQDKDIDEAEGIWLV